MNRKLTRLTAALALLAFLAVPLGMWGQTKITEYGDIVDGTKYYIGATTGGNDYYLSVDGSTLTNQIAGTAVTSMNDATPFTFEGSETTWTIQFESGYYLSLKNQKDNGKVQVVEDAVEFTASNQSGKLRLSKGDFSIQKNNSGTQFGSYGNTQTDIWLMAVQTDVTATTTTIVANITNTDVYVSTAAGSLSATVTETESGDAVDGATVTWTSSKENVATIDEDGVVTLVAAGTTTITASYAGVSGEFSASSATYELTVTSSAPYEQPTEFEIGLNNTLFGTTYSGSASGITDENPVVGTQDNVTVTYAGSGNHYVNDNQIRFYPNNKLTFEAPDGYVITQIEFTQDGTWTATISAEEGTYDSSEKTWTGNAASVLFTGSGSGRCDMSMATITLGTVSTDPTITINSGNIELDAAESDVATITVTYANLDERVAEVVLYSDEDCTNEVTVDNFWFTADFPTGASDEIIEYMAAENETTEPRVVYMRVVATDGEDFYYSNVITVTQAAPVIMYEVTFDVDGGEFVANDYFTEDAMEIEGGTYNLPSATKAGFTFAGWNDGDETYAANAEYTISANVDFVAQWTESTGGDVTFDATVDKDEDGDLTIEKEGVTFTCSDGALGNGAEYRIYKNKTATFSVESGTITKIEFTGVSSYGASGFEDMDGFTTSGNNGTWTGSAESVTFTATNKQVRATQIVVTVDNGGTPAPTITAENVSIDYDAESGMIEFTINNPASDGVLTVSEDVEWISDAVVSVGAPLVTFNTTVNDAATSRDGVVTLTYTYGDESVTKNVTVTQAGNPNLVDNIADITEVGTAYTVKGTVVATNSRGFVIGDGTGYVYTYLNNTPTQAVGDMVRISGTTANYGILIQFNNQAAITEAEDSEYDGTPEVTEITEVPEYSGNQLSHYLQFEGTLTSTPSGNYTNYNIAVGSSAIRISYPTADQEEALTELLNKTVRVHGFYAGNSGTTFTVMMESVEEVISTDPVLAVDPYQTNLTSAATTGTLAVTATNFSLEDVTESGFAIFDANWENILIPGDEGYPDWLTLAYDYSYGNGQGTVGYSVTENENTEARTAYFKLRLTYNSEDIYSDQITITQAAPVVDYATLPFTYTDEDVLASSNLSNMPNGLTQVGLGIYTASTPRLKFDTKDDELVLHTNGAPKAINFDIKGNGFAGGTFTVQISVDGTAYTDLAVFTELAGSTKTITLINTNPNVRYIKWVYTNRNTGNVALGNLHITTSLMDIDGNLCIFTDVTVAELTIPDNQPCTIYDGGTLNATVSLGNSGNAANLIIKEGGQLKTPSAVYATVEKNIVGYGEDNANTNKGYYLVSAPADKYLFVDSENADVDAYRFDAFQQDEEWQNFKTATGAWHISASSAVLYASKDDCTLSLDGYGIVYNHPNPGANVVNNKVPATNEDIDIDIAFNSGKTFEGVNLIGNPFTCTAYLADGRDFYRMNADGDAIVLADDSNGGSAIGVCEGIFVVATGANDNSVTFTTTEPTAVSGGPGALTLSLTQNQGSLIDNARIRFGEGRNTAKLTLNENSSRVYFAENAKDYMLVYSQAEGEMPVSFKAANDGSYTLTVEAQNVNMNYLRLIDNMTGANVDLLANPSYTFDARTTDYSSRFRLVYSANTGVEEGMTASETFAFFNGSEWMISNEGRATLQVVDMTGRVLSSETVNGNATLSENGLSQGVYMFQLINGSDVKIQKVIVR